MNSEDTLDYDSPTTTAGRPEFLEMLLGRRRDNDCVRVLPTTAILRGAAGMLTEPLGARFPLLKLYGDGPQEFLDEDAVVSASAEQRIRSVWPFLVRKVLAFVKTLSPRERVNFDTEDVLGELWVKLAERHSKWSPERGKWVTFVGAVIDRELAGIRDRASTIQAPRNSSCRVKAYRKREAAGTLTEKCRKSARDIARTKSGTHEIITGSAAESCRVDDPVAVLTASETSAQTAEVLQQALACLTSTQADVLSRCEGLGGRDPEAVPQIALAIGLSDGEVRQIRWAARATLRKRLIALKHPLVPASRLKTG